MRRVWSLVVLCAALSLVSCEGAGGGAAPASGDEALAPERLALRRQVLAQLGQQVLGTYQQFVLDAQALERATAAWASSGQEQDREQARSMWRAAMQTWQRAEVMQVGPAGNSSSTVAGQDLRDEIYSWPLVNRCRVDQELVEAAYQDLDAFATERINVRGLDAMEYLLFYQGAQNACEPNSAINRDGSWALIPAQELDQRRAAYAHSLAQLLVRDGQRLHQRWQEGFLAEVTGAGDGSQAFSSTQEALNAFSDAMFYLDKEAKDMKVAQPAGLANCGADTCPEALESALAAHSRENLLANLLAFEQLYRGLGPDGQDGAGFEELLEALGAQQLVQDLDAALLRARALLEQDPMPFAQLLEQDPGRLVEIYQGLKALTDLLKTQFIGLLDLELPQRAEGDND